MPGFPTRTLRSAFGPKLQNKSEVNDNTREIGAPTFNLAWWQTAGCSLASHMAWATVASNALVSAGEAFDPTGTLVPSVTHVATGVWELAYPTQVADEAGNMVPVVFLGGTATANPIAGVPANVLAQVEVLAATPYKARVYLTVANTGAAVDGNFTASLF